MAADIAVQTFFCEAKILLRARSQTLHFKMIYLDLTVVFLNSFMTNPQSQSGVRRTSGQGQSQFSSCILHSLIWLLCVTEEILQTHIAHWWSPDGLRLAYMTINDTLVPKMEVPFFTGTPYPASLEYHYPKARIHHSLTPILRCS